MSSLLSPLSGTSNRKYVSPRKFSAGGDAQFRRRAKWSPGRWRVPQFELSWYIRRVYAADAHSVLPRWSCCKPQRTMFDTERLTLRPFIESDADHLLRMWNQPEVLRGSSNDYLVPHSPKFKEMFTSWVASSPLAFNIIEAYSNVFLLLSRWRSLFSSRSSR